MQKHDFITTSERWSVVNKCRTEEELNEEFKKSRFKSHQAFLVSIPNNRNCLESRFWEWMETTSTKYNKDGSVYRKYPSNPDTVLSTSSSKFNNAMVIFLVALVSFAVIVNIF